MTVLNTTDSLPSLADLRIRMGFGNQRKGGVAASKKGGAGAFGAASGGDGCKSSALSPAQQAEEAELLGLAERTESGWLGMQDCDGEEFLAAVSTPVNVLPSLASCPQAAVTSPALAQSLTLLRTPASP